MPGHDQTYMISFQQACESVNKLKKESALELPRPLARQAVHEDFANIKTVRG